MRIRLAGIDVEVTDPTENVTAYLKDYAVPEEGPAAFSAGGGELLSLHREVAENMPRFDRLVCHGALIEAEGKGILFTAPSGTGKTTHVRLWKQWGGDRVRIINGDKPILSVSESGITAWGTPWRGKERMGENASVPLSAIVLLERGSKDRMQKEDPADHLDRLLQQIYLPEERAASEKTYELAERLFTRVPFYRLTCTMNRTAYEEAADVLLRESAERSDQ